MSIKVILLLEIIKKKVHLRKSFVYLSQTKGQLISKCLFGIINPTKKRAKNSTFTMLPQVELFLFIFWEN